MPESNEEKPKCPECETELVLVDGKPPDKCPKCGFILKGFAVMERWVTAISKRQAAAKKKATKKNDDDVSPFEALANL